MPETFTYVYLLRSDSHPNQTYVGITSDLNQRLSDHNGGKAKHTSKFRPWTIETYVAFSDVDKARAFERYLKSSSGIAFAKKRLR
ncbi:MAG: GIY-YIG nuclease family protein [Verrucomicrobiota bacterium]